MSARIAAPMLLALAALAAAPAVTLRTGRADAQEALRIERVRRSARAALGTDAEVTGTLVDAGTGEPIAGAIVSLDEAATLSDQAGGFRLPRVSGGICTLRVQHAAYGAPSAPLTLGHGEEVELRLHVAMKAIPLDSLEVTTRPERPRPADPLLTAGSIVTGVELEEALKRGETVAQVADRFPTIRVRYGRFSTTRDVATGACLESNRNTPRLQPQEVAARPGYPFCDAIAVFLDGMSVGNPVAFLRNLRLDDFESIEYVSSAFAGPRYGLEAGQGGVLLLTSKRR